MVRFFFNFPAFSVDDDAVGSSEAAAGVEELEEVGEGLGVPVADEGNVLGLGEGIRDGDELAAVDGDRAVAARGAVEGGGGVVVVAADLVLNLELVGHVGAGRDGAVGAGEALLPRVLALLDAVPREEDGLVEVVEDVDDDVVVGGAIDAGAGELVVDGDDLLGGAEGREGRVFDIPRVEVVGVLGVGRAEKEEEEEREGGGFWKGHFGLLVVVWRRESERVEVIFYLEGEEESMVGVKGVGKDGLP
ncbi:hypothetical protein SASPL_153363 [Salvia splendens]|uniref:Uncharacterized protein n=1 Tax=Salvia splendens TaxID=180675 RepID=A0A8X8W5L7_SALSN|nr:hypothetical protein SASPL_153363 [Salvia splendens]